MESMDDVAFIGRNPKDRRNVYIVTGDSAAGITHGTIARIVLRDLIVGRENLCGRLSLAASVPMLQRIARAIQFRALKTVNPRGLFRFNLYPQLRFGFLLGSGTPPTTLQNLC
jgi:hypothetical protein